MTNIKIIGTGDAQSRALRENLEQALTLYPLDAEVKEVSEFNQVSVSGVSESPALMIDDVIAVEGRVPTAEEIEKLLRNRALLKSKISRLKRILVPVDFSPVSETAFLAAHHIARVFGASIEVFYAYEGIFDGGQASPSGFLEGYLRSLKKELKDFVEMMTNRVETESGEKMPSVTMRLHGGLPEGGLIERSARFDLIVMGKTGLEGMPAWVFGSIGASVARGAHCPVMLVPEGATRAGMDFRNLLYASSFDSMDSVKVKEAVGFAKKFGAQVHFVHIVNEAEPDSKLDKTLFEIYYRYADAENPFLFSTIPGGGPISEKLNEYAAAHDVDLLVFVTHRRSFWQGLWHKSESRQMLFHAKFPLLILHSDDDVIN